MRKGYLDGLRGWASLFVVLSHLIPYFLVTGHLELTRLFIFDGPLAVYTFFVLSGYVLSVGYFESGQLRQVVAMAIRRYPRLTLPILISCTIAFLMMSGGLFFNVEAGNLAKSDWLNSFYLFEPELSSFLRFSLWDVYFRYDAQSSYNAVLWTMTYELLGSATIFATLLFTGRSWSMRAVTYVALVASTVYAGSPILALVLGMILADVTTAKIIRSNAAGIGMMVLGLVLAAIRYPSASVVGLSGLACLIVGGVLFSPMLQRALTAKASAWLGRVSFPLYLTHLIVICGPISLGYIWLIHRVDQPGFFVSSVFGVLALAMSLFVARVFAPVEEMAVSVSRYLSKTLMASVRLTPPVTSEH